MTDHAHPTVGCPTCGQDVADVRGVRIDRKRRAVVVDGQVRLFTGKQIELVAVLHAALGRTLSRGFILDALYPIEADQPDDQIIKVMLVHIRKRLAGTSLGVETVWGEGLRMVYAPPSAREAREAAERASGEVAA